MRGRVLNAWAALALVGMLPHAAAAQTDETPETADVDWRALEETVADAVDLPEDVADTARTDPTTTDPDGIDPGDWDRGQTEEARADAQEDFGRLDRMEEDPRDDLSVPSDAAFWLIDWVVASGDNQGLPFIVIDKMTASLLVFDADGILSGAAPALLGMAAGDDATPGIGDRDLPEIGSAERTPPAGRFQAQLGVALGWKDVLWVDHATSVALHPVVTGTRTERRMQRLRSATAEDNRITYGCINVRQDFYAEIVRPLFEGLGGIVYVLPEVKALDEVFPDLSLEPGTLPRPLETAI